MTMRNVLSSSNQKSGLNYLAAITAALLIAGCGGGGSTTNSNDSNTSKTYTLNYNGFTGSMDCKGTYYDRITVTGTYNQIELINCDIDELNFEASYTEIALTGTSHFNSFKYQSAGGYNSVYAPQYLLDKIPDSYGITEIEI